MRSRVEGAALALGWLLRTRETRLTSTLARAATSRIVTRFGGCLVFLWLLKTRLRAYEVVR